MSDIDPANNTEVALTGQNAVETRKEAVAAPHRRTLSSPSMSASQARALALLQEHQPVSPRSFAQLMWPDSPAWGHRTRKRGGRTGAIGGTMPMRGARMLWTLHGLGLARQNDDGTWNAA